MKFHEAAGVLKQGGVGVLPTDTLYGLVGAALKPETVERLYQMKSRDLKKPCIILISQVEQLARFKIELDAGSYAAAEQYWPGPVSIILPCRSSAMAYLHRGSESLAFRLPDNDNLRQLISVTGPLAAPSANPEGLPPAATIQDAKQYFGAKADFYIDGGHLAGKPSRLIRILAGSIETLRE